MKTKNFKIDADEIYSIVLKKHLANVLYIAAILAMNYMEWISDKIMWVLLFTLSIGVVVSTLGELMEAAINYINVIILDSFLINLEYNYQHGSDIIPVDRAERIRVITDRWIGIIKVFGKFRKSK